MKLIALPAEPETDNVKAARYVPVAMYTVSPAAAVDNAADKLVGANAVPGYVPVPLTETYAIAIIQPSRY